MLCWDVTGSPYRSLLSNALLILQEDGTLQTLRDRWWRAKECPLGINGDGSEPTGGPLDLTKLGGVFVLLLSGLGLSCVLAICEFIWKTKKMVREERVCSKFPDSKTAKIANKLKVKIISQTLFQPGRIMIL
ncbi:hypothetical protein LAZ67_18002560 [Cordylochernes scorpioides]|uniref:Uncharacterized protein n=1 Tax=Cordylochernes scorpioides TaxID=51811 RepID=A0ABY6LKV8_9ARAC|nr:hypothetical protein LAZ67_18002560 [Cordylochernes scorpioides]